MDLYPEFPENLEELSDEELAELRTSHEHVSELLESEDEETVAGLSADEIIAALEYGVEAIDKIVAEQDVRVEQQEAYEARKAELAARRKQHMAAEEDDGEGDGDGEEEAEAEAAEEVEEAAVEEEAAEEEEAEAEAEVEESALVASATTVVNRAERKQLRRPPAPSASRLPSEPVAVLTAASGLDGIRGGQPLDRTSLAEAMRTVARRLGPPAKSENGIEQRFFVAQANFPYPDDRRLMPGELDVNAQKIQKVIPDGITGLKGNKVLTASGGLCAPLENIYTMPNFAVTDRPVKDALPSFQADRGGVSVPEATIIGDINDAISTITADEDISGTFTKSCQDLECPDYTDVAVVVLAHCREYGNLNARAWPEKIAHENDLTMAALARTAESFLLDRIRAQSLLVSSSTTLGSFIDFVDALVRAAASIRYNLRMSVGANFRALMPAWVPDLLVDDTVRTQFAERFANQARVRQILGTYGVNVSYYLDTPVAGTSQAFPAEVDSTTLDAFPADVQIAMFPEGAFLHLDGGSLDLGIVRDSTLNSTNDFQIFGEIFENVVRIAPLQATRWITLTTAPTGQFPVLV